VAVAGAAAIGDPKPFEYTPPLMGLVMFLELLAGVALVWILVWQPEARGRHIGPRLVVVLSGTTAFGFVHVITEYFTMLSFGGSNWGNPDRLWVPHRRRHHHQRHPDRDHDPTCATEGCRR